MDTFYVVKNGIAADLLIEAEALEGVLMIAETVAEDIQMVGDVLPAIVCDPGKCKADRVVLVATLGVSPLLTRLEREGKLNTEGIREKREVYMLRRITLPYSDAPGIRELLVIAGSDKRGTIYGMFRLSEMIGVSPLVYFGDAVPVKSEAPALELNGTYVSKEPSVKYRGFFINDEWPAFGNWCVDTFGGINVKAYRKVFELLLRLKGNYMWPAMWRSVFSEDGPGAANAELADCLGVIIGLSHHEPMCRAGAEWQQIYRKYGEDPTWSFVSNAPAITRFWEDGILRNRPFENIVTIGMRGENDSELMPEGSTMKDNVEVIKSAIRTQHSLLRKNWNEDLKKIPRMLAIYKEVEDYYYGDESCEGLKDWDELQDVIFLLSDDNYGHLRRLPQGHERNHPGGFGMYYHFDYHGAPVSYEWTNCNRLTKTWEQMTQAYEAGVREMWIVNVGDIKAVEYPLCYFMELAYDYETWGSGAVNATEMFARRWLNIQFADRLTPAQKEKMFVVLDGYTKWNAARFPEAMYEGVYHPVHFREGECVRKEVSEIIETAQELNANLTGAALDTYRSMIYYPAVASLNLVLAWVEAAMNKVLAQRGCVYANVYAQSVRERVENDAKIVAAYHAILGGKWNHIMSSAHTGFRDWDDKDWTYPTTQWVTPLPIAKAVVSFRGSDAYHLGAHWQDRGPMINDDFTRPDTEEVLLDVDSRGHISFSYELVYDCPWLRCDVPNGRVEVGEGGRATLCFTVDRAKFDDLVETDCRLNIRFDNGQRTWSDIRIVADGRQSSKECFVERQGRICIRAEHFSEKKDVDGKGFFVIEHLGREGAAVKALPAMEVYEEPATAPSVTYRFEAGQTAEYQLCFLLLTRNPSVKNGRIRFAFSVNGDEPQAMAGVPKNYYTEWFDKDWADGVRDHARRVETKVKLNAGLNELTVYAGDPGFVFEKIMLWPATESLPDSYFGPEESFCRH